MNLQPCRVWLVVFSPTKVRALCQSSRGWSGLSETNLCFTGLGDVQHVLPRACGDGCPLRAALQGAPKEQERRGKGLPWLSAH